MDEINVGADSTLNWWTSVTNECSRRRAKYYEYACVQHNIYTPSTLHITGVAIYGRLVKIIFQLLPRAYIFVRRGRERSKIPVQTISHQDTRKSGQTSRFRWFVIGFALWGKYFFELQRSRQISSMINNPNQAAKPFFDLIITHMHHLYYVGI